MCKNKIATGESQEKLRKIGSEKIVFKGIVKRKLRRVEIGHNGQSCSSVGALGVVFFILKGTPSWIMQKTFDRHLSPNYW